LAAARAYAIPRGSIALALTQLADESGVRMIYRTRLTKDLTTPGLSGTYTLNEALDALLSGTGLGYKVMEDGRAVAIILAQADDGVRSDAGAEALPPIDVGAEERRHDGMSRGKGEGGGPGGRFTGYAADPAKPAAASKTNVPLLQSPMNIQSVTREMLDDRQSLSLKDALLFSVSGMNMGYQNYDRFMIRGFDTFDPMYRNGVRTPQEVSRETGNIQTIEVVKGLSSMLYGRSEPGGLVNFVTKRPLFDQTYYSIQEQTGSFGLTRTSVDLTGPLFDDKTFAYRLNAVYQRSDSFLDFVTSRSGFVAPSLSWRPIEQFRLNVEAEFRDRVYVEDTDHGIPVIGRGVADIPNSRYLQNPTFSVGRPQHTRKAFFGYDWTYDISPDWSVTNRFAYSFLPSRRNSTSPYAIDETTGIMQRGLFYRTRTVSTVSTNIDIKGNFDTGPLNHKVLLGFDYLNNRVTDAGCSFWMGSCDYGAGITSVPINIYAPYYSPIRLDFQPPYNDFFKSREDQKGVYGQDFISFFDDRLHILLGGRYDWARYGSVTSGTSFADIDSRYFYNPDSAFSPHAGVVVQPWPWLSFYGNFSQSFGLSNGRPAPDAAALPPQRGLQWEGGVKAELLDKRLTATFAYFDITKTNILAAVFNGGYNVPIGAAESKGIEFDLTGRIDDNWSLIATYAHTDAVITSDKPRSGALVITGDNSGHRLMNIPRNQGSLWVKYTGQAELVGLSLGAGLVAVDERPGDNGNTSVVPGYATVDLFGSYKLPLPANYPALTVQINVKNLLDTQYYEGVTFDRLVVNPGPPRAVLVSLRAEF
jgi:iron complex outermembrane receptor protein